MIVGFVSKIIVTFPDLARSRQAGSRGVGLCSQNPAGPETQKRPGLCFQKPPRPVTPEPARPTFPEPGGYGAGAGEHGAVAVRHGAGCRQAPDTARTAGP